MKTLICFLCGSALFIATAGFSQLRSGDNIVIDERVDDDLYVAGGTVTVNAPVEGDLIVAGGTVTVNDSIYQDMLVAGGTIIIDGYVGDDIRCAGGSIKIADQIGGDLVVTGGTVQIGNNALVKGDLLVSGGKVIVDGAVNGNVQNASGEFTLNGRVGKDLSGKGGKIIINGTVDGTSVISARTIEVGPRAIFKDDVRFWNKEQALDFGNSLEGGEAIFDSSLELADGKWHYLGFGSFLMLLWYLGTALVMITLIQYLFSRTFRNAANTVKNASLKSLGVGFLFLMGVPVVIVVTIITIIGLPIAALLLIAYAVLLVLATVIVSLLAANWINNTYYHSAWAMGRIVIAAFVIFIFLKLASLTPVIGPLIMLLLVGMSFGGILLNVRWKRNKALALT